MTVYGPGAGEEFAAAEPKYSKPIIIIDSMRGSLNTVARKARWTEGRDKALSQWGLPFQVRFLDEAKLPYRWTTKNINGGLAITDIRKNAILIVHDYSLPGQASGGWSDLYRGGIVEMGPWDAWWQETGENIIASTTAHELGHALGFGHSPDEGIMSGSQKPNDAERAWALAYYTALWS